LKFVKMYMGLSQPGRNLNFIFLGFSINFASMLASSGLHCNIDNKVTAVNRSEVTENSDQCLFKV
jgi:hypothetical protein